MGMAKKIGSRLRVLRWCDPVVSDVHNVPKRPLHGWRRLFPWRAAWTASNGRRARRWRRQGAVTRRHVS